MNPDPYPVLPRHVTDGLPESWLAVPPPPLDFSHGPHHFRPAAEGPDAEMICEWMNRPHTAKGWEYDWPLDRWQTHLKAQLATDYSRPIVVERDGQPIAYMEFYRMAQDVVGHHYRADAYDLSMHLAIADLSDTGGGLGSRLVGEVTDEFFRLDPRCNAVIYEPDSHNSASRRMIEKNAASLIGEVQVRHRHIALYAKAREGFPLPTLKTD